MMLSLVWPIASLGFLLSMTQESFTAANRVAEIFDAPREIADGPQSEAPAGGRLEVRDVGFRFPDSDQWALRHVTVTVEPGETLALVGSTGSGKTVLAALLSRLYDVTEGQICIDGQDIRELSLDALRQTRTCGWAAALTIPPATRSLPRPSTSPRGSSSTTCRSASTPASASRA
jgi:ATP-binding cassette subfamily B protein